MAKRRTYRRKRRSTSRRRSTYRRRSSAYSYGGGYAGGVGGEVAAVRRAANVEMKKKIKEMKKGTAFEKAVISSLDKGSFPGKLAIALGIKGVGEAVNKAENEA